MSQVHWEVVKRVVGELWPLITLLIGVFAGGYITNRNQRKFWVLDNKRAEYRKLLTTLSECASQVVRVYGRMQQVEMAKSDHALLAKAATKSANVIYNRLFIAREVQRLNVMERWQNTVDALRNGRNVQGFTNGLDSLMNDIRQAALKDFS